MAAIPAEVARLSRSQVEAAAWREVRRPVAIMLTDATGRTQTPLRTTGLTWPGISTVRPEPVAQIEAAHALQTAAHALIGDLIPRAREAGRSWYEIGDALDLHGQAVGANEPVAEVAYDYALEYQVGTSMRRLTWTCPACHRLITHRGPFDCCLSAEKATPATAPAGPPSSLNGTSTSGALWNP